MVPRSSEYLGSTVAIMKELFLLHLRPARFIGIKAPMFCYDQPTEFFNHMEIQMSFCLILITTKLICIG